MLAKVTFVGSVSVNQEFQQRRSIYLDLDPKTLSDLMASSGREDAEKQLGKIVLDGLEQARKAGR